MSLSFYDDLLRSYFCRSHISDGRFVVLLFKGLQSFFLYAGHIGAGYAKLFGDFTLGKWFESVESVSPLDDVCFPLVKTLVDEAVKLFGLYVQVDLVDDAVVLGDNVYKGEGVAVLVGIYGLVKVDVPCGFFQGAEVHEYLICYPHYAAL